MIPHDVALPGSSLQISLPRKASPYKDFDSSSTEREDGGQSLISCLFISGTHDSASLKVWVYARPVNQQSGFTLSTPEDVKRYLAWTETIEKHNTIIPSLEQEPVQPLKYDNYMPDFNKIGVPMVKGIREDEKGFTEIIAFVLEGKTIVFVGFDTQSHKGPPYKSDSGYRRVVKIKTEALKSLQLTPRK